MKKIGFIDFYLDEWHANNYPQWIRDNCRANGRDCILSYAWADMARPEGLDTAAWCDKYKVDALSTIDELVEKSDYILVLSPDNPEHHEKLSRIPLMSGKPVYIDKTFSPDLLSGVRMFDLADKYATPMFSSSALRFAEEFSSYPDSKVNRTSLEYVATLGPGCFENYSVHQLEMIICLMGPGISRVKCMSTNHTKSLISEYADGRRASMLQIQDVPFQASLQLKSGEGIFISQCSNIFPRLVHAMLDFFETGIPPVPKEETLEIMALLDAGFKAVEKDDTWITVEHP